MGTPNQNGYLYVSFGFILDELLDCLPGTDHQAGVLLQELEEESVHVAVGMQRPQGITTFLSIGKTVCVCVCTCAQSGMWCCTIPGSDFQMCVNGYLCDYSLLVTPRYIPANSTLSLLVRRSKHTKFPEESTIVVMLSLWLLTRTSKREGERG